MNRLTCLALLLCFASNAFAEDPPIFEDTTNAAGLSETPSRRVSFADFNRDGHPDLILSCRLVWMNQGDGTFKQTWEGDKRTSCCAIADVNNDGYPDLYIGRNTDFSNEKFTDDHLRNELHLGDGKGGFTRVDDSGVEAGETTISACFVDYDRDGNVDLFVGNQYTAYGKSYEAFPDRLFKGAGDGTFVEVTKEAGIEGVAAHGRADSRRPTYGVCHTDWNNDGWQDLLVMSYGRQWNRLWKNNGDGTFTDVAPETTFDGDSDRSGKHHPRAGRKDEQPFRSNGNTFDAAVADFDNDGDMDVFLGEITHWWAMPSSDLSMILINQGAEKNFTFKRDPSLITRKHSVQNWNQGDLHAGWMDVDNDGLLDLLVASSDYPDDQILQLYHQNPDHTFEDWTEKLGFRWLNASQLTLGDYDRDGATDILLGTSNMRLTKEQKASREVAVALFRNTLPERLGNSFFSLRLEGEPIGARVTIWIDGTQQTREVQGGLGHAGHRDDTECRFGVGKAATIDKVEVTWPDKDLTKETFENVKTGRLYTLKKGDSLKVVSD
jgi:hypothetical protein